VAEQDLHVRQVPNANFVSAVGFGEQLLRQTGLAQPVGELVGVRLILEW